MTHTDTICQFVDTIVDEYSMTKKKIRVDFYKYFQSEDIDRKTINEYASNQIHIVTDVLEEIDGALSGDELLSQAYSHFKKSELKEFKSLLDRFVSDVEKYKDSKRITRRKKIKSPDQLVKGLNLIQESVIINNKKYDHISKDKIIGSKSVLLINMKTNDLLYLTGTTLSCSGAKIINYDESESGLKKIKKIESTIEKIKSSNNLSCSKIFQDLPNKKRPVPRTVSPNFFILKIIA